MKKKIKIILIVLFVILLILSFLGYYLKKNKSNAYNIFGLFLNNIYEKISNQYDYNANAIEGNIKLKSSSLDYYFESSTIDLVMGSSYDLDFNIDYKNKVALFDLNSYHKNEDNINIKKYYYENGEYTYISNNLDSYVRKTLSNDDFNNIFNILKPNIDNLNILKGLKNAIMCTDNSVYFEQIDKSQKIKIDKKNYNLYINTLYINQKNYLILLNNINKYLMNNKEFLSSYKKIYKKDYSINDYNNIVEYLKKGETKIIIYTNSINGKFVKLDIEKSYENKTSISELYVVGNHYYIKTQFDNNDIEIEASFSNGNGDIKVALPNYNGGKDSNIDISYSFKYVKEIKAEDVTNATSIYNVTSEKYNEVYNNIVNRVELLNFYKIYEMYKKYENPNYLSQSMSYIW